MATAATKPVRIYELDHAPLRLLAATQKRSQADIVHDALSEYVERHRDSLTEAFEGAQAAIASGSIAELSAFLEAGASDRVAKQVERMRALQGS